MKRVFFDILLCLAVFLLPWWATLILSIIGLFLFTKFYEFLVFSIIIYLLSSVPTPTFINSSFFVYLSIIIFYLLVQYLRSRIILYKNEIPYKT